MLAQMHKGRARSDRLVAVARGERVDPAQNHKDCVRNGHLFAGPLSSTWIPCRCIKEAVK